MTKSRQTKLVSGDKMAVAGCDVSATGVVVVSKTSGGPRGSTTALAIIMHHIAGALDRGIVAPVQKSKLTMRRRWKLPKPLVGSFARFVVLLLVSQALGVEGKRPYSEIVSERRGRNRREAKEQVLPTFSSSRAGLDLDLGPRTKSFLTWLDRRTAALQPPSWRQASLPLWRKSTRSRRNGTRPPTH